MSSFTTWYPTTPSFSKAETSDQNRRIVREIEYILEYAENKYQCIFSKVFRQQLLDGCNERVKIPSKKAIDALIKEWKVWEEYVSPDSFSSFIEDGIKSLIQIQATATFYALSLNGYIGNKAQVIKELPAIATSVSFNGVLSVNGRRVKEC